MADAQEQPPRHTSYVRQARDFAMGTHPLAKHTPPLLLLADAILTSLIIWKVPCTSQWFLQPP